MYGDQPEDVFYYLTLYNEPYVQPAEPAEVDAEGIVRGMYLLGRRRRRRSARAGARLRRRRAVGARGAAPAARGLGRARRRLVGHLVDRAARDGPAVDRVQPARARVGAAHGVTSRSASRGRPGPVVAVSDYVRELQDMIRPWVPSDYATLGTDGWGMSDTRGALRRHFLVVDAEHHGAHARPSLAERGEVERSTVAEAIARYQLDDPPPRTPATRRGAG